MHKVTLLRTNGKRHNRASNIASTPLIGELTITSGSRGKEHTRYAELVEYDDSKRSRHLVHRLYEPQLVSMKGDGILLRGIEYRIDDSAVVQEWWIRKHVKAPPEPPKHLRSHKRDDE